MLTLLLVGGHEGEGFIQNGVTFDGAIDGALIEVKGHYAQFIDKENGEFLEWFPGFGKQARAQLEAAEGAPVKWYFAEEEVANLARKFFDKNGLGSIEVIFVPPDF